MEVSETGLTKREYIAAQILSGMLANATVGIELQVSKAVKAADVLIAELNKTELNKTAEDSKAWPL